MIAESPQKTNMEMEHSTIFNTVDGWNPANQFIIGSLSHYLHLFIALSIRWLFGISAIM